MTGGLAYRQRATSMPSTQLGGTNGSTRGETHAGQSVSGKTDHGYVAVNRNHESMLGEASGTPVRLLGGTEGREAQAAPLPLVYGVATQEKALR